MTFLILQNTSRRQRNCKTRNKKRKPSSVSLSSTANLYCKLLALGTGW